MFGLAPKIDKTTLFSYIEQVVSWHGYAVTLGSACSDNIFIRWDDVLPPLKPQVSKTEDNITDDEAVDMLCAN